jgi:hypothetical protein
LSKGDFFVGVGVICLLFVFIIVVFQMSSVQNIEDLINTFVKPAIKRFQKVVEKSTVLDVDEKNQLNEMHTTLTTLIKKLKSTDPDDTGELESISEEATKNLDTLKKLYKRADSLGAKAGRSLGFLMSTIRTTKGNSTENEKRLARNEIKLIIQILKVGFLMVMNKQSNLAVCANYEVTLADNIHTGEDMLNALKNILKSFIDKQSENSIKQRFQALLASIETISTGDDDSSTTQSRTDGGAPPAATAAVAAEQNGDGGDGKTASGGTRRRTPTQSRRRHPRKTPTRKTTRTPTRRRHPRKTARTRRR